jgi:hypothetical protein
MKLTYFSSTILSCEILTFQSHQTRPFNAKNANHVLKKTSKQIHVLVYHHFRAIIQEAGAGAGAHWLVSHGLFGRAGMDKEAGGLNNWGGGGAFPGCCYAVMLMALHPLPRWWNPRYLPIH